jgi:hypothetical protein
MLEVGSKEKLTTLAGQRGGSPMGKDSTTLACAGLVGHSCPSSIPLVSFHSLLAFTNNFAYSCLLS